jgi:hypothetical protein
MAVPAKSEDTDSKKAIMCEAGRYRHSLNMSKLLLIVIMKMATKK